MRVVDVQSCLHDGEMHDMKVNTINSNSVYNVDVVLVKTAYQEYHIFTYFVNNLVRTDIFGQIIK